MARFHLFRLPSFRPLLPSLVMFLTAFLAASTCSAQAGATATRTLDLSVFAGGMHLSTDYNDVDYGVVFGADLTRRFRRFDGALEVRATLSNQGNAVKENTFSGGLKLGKSFSRFHPYADFLIGNGTITFTHPTLFPTGVYSSDNSAVFSFGGGLDYRIAHGFSAKVDYNQQSWRLGDEQNRLTPAAFTFGVAYSIPFGPHRPH